MDAIDGGSMEVLLLLLVYGFGMEIDWNANAVVAGHMLLLLLLLGVDENGLLLVVSARSINDQHTQMENGTMMNW
jgi:hypothetical protein